MIVAAPYMWTEIPFPFRIFDESKKHLVARMSGFHKRIRGAIQAFFPPNRRLLDTRATFLLCVNSPFPALLPLVDVDSCAGAGDGAGADAGACLPMEKQVLAQHNGQQRCVDAGR